MRPVMSWCVHGAPSCARQERPVIPDRCAQVPRCIPSVAQVHPTHHLLGFGLKALAVEQRKWCNENVDQGGLHYRRKLYENDGGLPSSPTPFSPTTHKSYTPLILYVNSTTAQWSYASSVLQSSSPTPQ